MPHASERCTEQTSTPQSASVEADSNHTQPKSSGDQHEQSDNTFASAEEERQAAIEEERRAAIEESRRKLAELEKDRPLWEAEARKRAASEAEELRLRAAAQAERQRRQAAAEQAAAEQVAAAAGADETEKRVQAELEHRRREREAYWANQRNKWANVDWDAHAAIARYQALVKDFDRAKFSVDNPADFFTIPWPVLHSPATLKIEDINWSAAEAFWEAVKKNLPNQYRRMVTQARFRFHPDSWAGRGVLAHTVYPEERDALAAAATQVCQALCALVDKLRLDGEL